jgi:hypothetical protein
LAEQNRKIQGVFGASISDLTVLPCSAASHKSEVITSSTRTQTARLSERREISNVGSTPAPPPFPPPPPPRWRRPRQRRGLRARYSTFPPNSSIHPSSSGCTPPGPPPRWNRPSPSGHRRRLSSISNLQRLRDSGGRATPALPSSNRCTSSASTSSPTYTASTYLSAPFPLISTMHLSLLCYN